MGKKIRDASFEDVFISPNEEDRYGEAANVVDALFKIARALDRIADALAVIQSDGIGANVVQEK